MARKEIFDNMYISVLLCPRDCNRGGKSTLKRSSQDNYVRCSECGWWGWFDPNRITVKDVNARAA